MARRQARWKVLAVAALLIVSLATGLLILPSTSFAAEDLPPTIHVMVETEYTYQTVDVAYGIGAANLRGFVEVEKQSIKPETIHMTVEDLPWEWAMTPSDQQVSGMADSFTFAGTVSIPKAYEQGEFEGKVVATWYDIDSVPHSAYDEFTIRVRNIPWYFYIGAQQVELNAGDSIDIAFSVTDNSPFGLTYVCNIDGLTSPGPLPWLDWSVAGLDREELVLGPGEGQTFYLHIAVPSNASTSTFHIKIKVVPEGYPEHTSEANILVSVKGVPVPQPPGTDDDDDSWLPFPVIWLWYMVAFGAIVGVIGFFGFTEVGLLMVLWSLLLPLFTRLRRNEVLNQFTRGEIFGFIQANPGVHLTSIKENLGLANGVLAYHLKVLIREEFIVARREGGYKRFYPKDMKVPRKRVHFTRLQLDIIDKLSTRPGLTQVALSRLLDESKQVINYNISVLMAADMVRVERDGGRTRCYVTKEAPKAAPEDDEVFDVEAEPTKGSPSHSKI
jgi:predicted transcriptional regulator